MPEPNPTPTIVEGGALLPNELGGCAGGFLMFDKDGQLSFHFTRIPTCLSAADFTVHEPSRRIVAVRSYAADRTGDMITAYDRWAQLGGPAQ